MKTDDTTTAIVPLWPRWMENVGVLMRMNALVRTHCCECGTLMRAELEDVIARHGPDHRLIDRLERCQIVGCAGSTFYLASRTYGREWTRLLRNPALADALRHAPREDRAQG